VRFSEKKLARVLFFLVDISWTLDHACICMYNKVSIIGV